MYENTLDQLPVQGDELMNAPCTVYVEDLRLKFPGESQLMFKDVSFAAKKGEKVLLLGPSGCGKSTLLQVLSGMIPNAIEVPMKCTGQQIPSSWAYVFQDPDTQFCMPYVDEELAFVLENLSVPQGDMVARMNEVLGKVGLQLDDPHMPISHLSQGMKQRLALASTLLLQPDVLFLDEPSALLDPEGREQIWEAVKSVSDGRTLIIVEHRIEEMVEYVDRVVLFGPSGEILGEGRPEHIFTAFQQELKDYGIWYPGVWDDYIRSEAGADSKAKAKMDYISAIKGHVEQGSDVFPYGSLSENIDLGRIETDTITRSGGLYPVMELRDITVLRKKEVVVQLERGVVYPEEFIAVTGPNGAGKSSLLLGLIGLLPLEGEYHLAGEVVMLGKKRKERKLREQMLRRIGFVFQNPELQFVTERVLDEVAYSLLVDGVTLAQAEQAARELLDRFGLSGLEHRHPYQLSTGQKRRLSVATAMARQPKVLLLDEPTFGQDARNTFAILKMCEELRQAGTAIIMVTHEMQIAQYAATQIWDVREGSVVSHQVSSRMATGYLGSCSRERQDEQELSLAGVSR